MLLKSFHDKLTQDREFTYLTAAADAATGTLTVAGIDVVSWVNGDYVLIGEFGEETAEIKAIDAATAAGTSLSVADTTFAHPIGTKVYHLDYNQVRFTHSTTADSSGTLAVLATIAIEPSNLFTRYEDTTYTTGYGSVQFRNSTTSALSSYAAFVPYSGYTMKSLWKIREKVKRLLKDETISDLIIDESINDAQREIAHDRLWNFAKYEASLSTVANQVEYTIPSTITIPHSITVDSDPIALIDQARWDVLHWEQTVSSDEITHCNISGTTIKLYPQLKSSASTTTLGAAISSATATTITVVATSAFRFSPYARLIIDSEVIYATGSTSTTFTGCLRGREGTTAAAHLIAATVTERDIVVFGQKEPVDLVDTTDETDIPEPMGIALRASVDLAYSLKDDKALADRLEKKYEIWIAGFRDRYSLRLKSAPAFVKDASDVITDQGMFRDPNRYPYQLDTTSGS